MSKQSSISIPSLINPLYCTHKNQDVTRLLNSCRTTYQPWLPDQQPAQDLPECPKCDKVFETRDDMKWHYENKYGREDCIILQKMKIV